MYAPIAIPTLNRVRHLIRCIESLESCNGAEFTDVYVSVDFPPSENYFQGYHEVVDYLKEKKRNNRFQALHVYFQKANLGPSANIAFLFNIIREFSDVVISTEDDNEFAPNFLEYVNKGLSILENDSRVIAICGCKEEEWYAPNSSVIALQMYPAYGVGKWFSKDDQFVRNIRETLLNPKELKKSDFRRLKREDRTLFNHYILCVLLSEGRPFYDNGELCAIDTVRSIYMHLSDKFAVVPMTSTSRTWGNDGTGVNMAAVEGLNPADRWPLDKNSTFDYVINGKEIRDVSDYRTSEFAPITVNHKIENEYMKSARSFKGNIKADLGYIILRICDYDIEKARRIKGQLKRLRS